ncbi:MAG: Gfo/Idh/MocA family oxidoreductase [Ruminococcaceae bacterium]|nr:Gfo/Idh/MocA family oxidoreductase [Oscillospiraceae bacterium]
MAEKLKIGIIGTGGIAHAHMGAYMRRIEKFDDIEIVAGCDIVPGKAEKFFEEFGVEGVRCYESHEEMLEKEQLDGVSVCTYNRQHAAPTICALNHGVNVILEKPFAVTLEECVEMMRAEKASGKILTVGFQPRFDQNMQQIKRIVESGELGDVYYIQTGGGRRRGIPASDTKTTFIEDETAGVGALGDIGCYSLDMVLNAIGYPMPLTVSGFKNAHFGKDPETYRYKNQNPEYIASKFSVDDFAGALIRLEGDIILDFRISWAMNMDTPGDTLILGTKAGLRIPSTNCWNGTVGGPMTIYRECAGQSMQMTVPIIPDDPKAGDLWDRKVGSFITAVREGGEAPVPTSQIIKNQAIIDGVLRSSAIGREVEITIPEI